MGASDGASEIPLPLSFFYLFDEAEMVRKDPFWCQEAGSNAGRSVSETSQDGEFGWGGTSVKQ